MGMDVFGKEPKSKVGEYFRNNIWWWHPLADYCAAVAPVWKMVKHPHTNDGSGLSGTEAVRLATSLQSEIDSGRCAAYAAKYEAEREAMPDEVCFCCGGTGRRAVSPNIGPGAYPCNGCGGDVDTEKPGTGKVRPHSSHYPFSVENVQEFVVFLWDCGGFRIS